MQFCSSFATKYLKKSNHFSLKYFAILEYMNHGTQVYVFSLALFAQQQQKSIFPIFFSFRAILASFGWEKSAV